MWELLGNISKILGISQTFFQNSVSTLAEGNCGEFGEGPEHGNEGQRSNGKQDPLKEANK